MNVLNYHQAYRESDSQAGDDDEAVKPVGDEIPNDDLDVVVEHGSNSLGFQVLILELFVCQRTESVERTPIYIPFYSVVSH